MQGEAEKMSQIDNWREKLRKERKDELDRLRKLRGTKVVRFGVNKGKK